MGKGQRFVWYGTLIFVFFLGFFTTSAVAENGDFSLRLWGQVSPFVSGDAGSGKGAPDYNDAFKSGGGGGIEMAYRPSRYFSCLIGAGHESYGGKTYQEISFDNWEVTPLYVGGKLHLNPKESKWNPYLRLDLGTAYLSNVDIFYESLKGRYWDSSWVFMFDIGAGIEYRFGGCGLSLELRSRYLDNPDSAMGHPSDADSSWTLPINLGFNLYF